MSANSLEKITILYIEDEEMIRNEVTDILQDQAHALYTATNGKEGLALYNRYKPDIVMTDIRMPQMDGLTLCRAILAINKDAHIIISSAYNDTKYLMETIKLGIHHYLLKPINVKELFVTLEKAAFSVINLKRLKESEKLLTQYKEAVDKREIVSKTDVHGIITYANDAFCNISGYTREELIGKSHSIVRHPETKPEIFKKLWDTILAKKEWHSSIKNRAKDGSTYIVESTIIPVLTSNDEIEEFISIRKDVTQRELSKQKLEKKLQTSAQTLDEKIQFIYEYEKALKQSTLFCRTTKESNITISSNAFNELLGLDESNVIGLPYFSLLDESDVTILNTKVHQAINAHKPWNGMLKHKNSSNEILYLDSSVIPILDIKGNLSEVFCFYKDFTKQVHLNREIIATQKEVIATMGAIGETRSKETGDHVKRVAEYSKLLALKYGISQEEAEEIKMASPMHDIGKVGISDEILNKPGTLSHSEYEIMKTHTTLGYEMIKGSQQSLLKTAAIISLEHHEKWDGSGYPQGLKGTDIHLYGRITAIADVFDALGHDRVYKKAWPLNDILEFFKEHRSKHFDPTLIDLFFNHLDDFLAIKDLFDSKKKGIHASL